MRWTTRLVLMFLSLWIIGGMWFYNYGASYRGPAYLRSQVTDITPLGCNNQKQCRARLANFLDNVR